MKPLILLMSLMLSLSVQAQVYKWVDKDGNVHFSDQPPPDEESHGSDHLFNSRGLVPVLDQKRRS